ncbi:hypothetical protein [Dactylosporangium sp. NPDC048998]|uniref:hypothetical protein n=1 Tax=Dactylosporangium sp. NPDC048998 TaxID=3363976 RepID=UPI00371D01E2
MLIHGKGVAYSFWLAVEQERAAQGLTKMDLWNLLKERAGDGPTPARSTIDNLRDSTRAPQPRIVHALADTLGIDREEARRMAGLAPSQPMPGVTVRSAIEASTEYTKDEKQALLTFIDAIERAKGTSRATRAESA